MNRFAWRASITLVGVAAASVTGWSLYVVAHDTYGVPWLLAGGAVAVYDGAAIACMFLASEAVREGRTAVGALGATLLMASLSVYLNITHARLLEGSVPTVPAAVLFSSPTVALLLPAGLAWSAGRYRARVGRGEAPFRLPGFGPWAWMLAGEQAWQTTRSRAVAHVTDDQPEAPAEPVRTHSATDVLRERFAEMDPAEAIRIAHEAQPEMRPAELAELLVTYGVIVDVVQVALVLGVRPPEVTVERGDTPDAQQVPALPAVSLEGAVIEAASALGPDANPRAIADHLRSSRSLLVGEPYIRTALSRERGRHTSGGASPDAGRVGQGGEGYN